MVRHRLRQSSNLLGPSGLISMEDASIFHRIHIGNHTPGAAIFQIGVRDKEKIEYEFLQNAESGNLPRCEYYRAILGFESLAACPLCPKTLFDRLPHISSVARHP